MSDTERNGASDAQATSASAAKGSAWRKLFYVGLVGCGVSVAWFLLFAVEAINSVPRDFLSDDVIIYVNPLCLFHNFTNECRGGMSYLGRETSMPTYVPYLLWASLVVVAGSLFLRRRKAV